MVFLHPSFKPPAVGHQTLSSSTSEKTWPSSKASYSPTLMINPNKPFWLGIKSPVHRIGKKPDWTGKNQTFSCSSTIPWKIKPKKPMKQNRFQPVWLGSNRTCVVLVNTLRLQLFWRKMVKNCMCYSQNDMLLSNPTCTTTCSYCFLRCRKLLSL